MKKLNYLGFAIVLIMGLVLAGTSSFNASASPLGATSPSLGTMDSFAVFADSLISSAGNASTINGNVGLEDGTGAAIGVQCGEVNGTIYDRDGAYTGAGGGSTLCLTTNAGFLTGADSDLVTTYDALAAGPNAICTTSYVGGQDLTLVSPLGPGVYCVDATGFTLTGNLTLSGSGVWIFRSATTIITSPGSSVTGGNTCDVWWRAETSVTLDTTTVFRGNVLALDSITMNNGATLAGRALARNGAVTLDTNTITRGPLCAAAPAPTATTASDNRDRRATEQAGAVSGLPDTGGAPIQNQDFPWNVVIVGSFSAIGLALGIRTYRRTRNMPKQ